MFWLRIFSALIFALSTLSHLTDLGARDGFHAPHGRDGHFARAVGANSTITAPASLPTASECAATANCKWNGPELWSYGWQKMNVTANITAATIVYIVNNRTNTTRTSTKFNDLPSGYTQQPTNSDGTVVYPITISVWPNGTTTSLLTYPTQYSDYGYTYDWSGTAKWNVSGHDYCTTAPSGGAHVSFKSHPTLTPIPTPYQWSSDWSSYYACASTASAASACLDLEPTTGHKFPESNDEFGVLYTIHGGGIQQGFSDSTLFPELTMFESCSRSAWAPAAVVNTAALLTATSTQHEDEGDDTSTSSTPATPTSPSVPNAPGEVQSQTELAPTEASTAAAVESQSDLTPTPSSAAAAAVVASQSELKPTSTQGSGGNVGGAIASILNSSPTQATPNTAASPEASSPLGGNNNAQSPEANQPQATTVQASTTAGIGDLIASMLGMTTKAAENTAASAPSQSNQQTQPVSTGQSTQNEVAPLATVSGVTVVPASSAQGGVVVGSATIQPNQAATVGSVAISLQGSSVLVVGSSSISLAAVPAATPNAVTIAAGQVISVPPSQSGVAVVGGQTLSAGGVGVTISGTPISIESGGSLVLGSSTVSLPANSESAQPGAVTAAAGQIISVPSSQSGVAVVDGQTLSAGGQGITISGTLISVASGGSLVVGSSTVALPTENPFPASDLAVMTVAGKTISANPQNPSIAIVGSQTLSAGGSAMTVSGTPISIASGGSLVVGSSTVALPSLSVTSVAITTIGGHTISANPYSPSDVVVGGVTLTADGKGTTIDGTVVSVAEGGSLVIGSSTMAIPHTTTNSAGQTVITGTGSVISSTTASETGLPTPTGSSSQRSSATGASSASGTNTTSGAASFVASVRVLVWSFGFWAGFCWTGIALHE